MVNNYQVKLIFTLMLIIQLLHISSSCSSSDDESYGYGKKGYGKKKYGMDKSEEKEKEKIIVLPAIVLGGYGAGYGDSKGSYSSYGNVGYGDAKGYDGGYGYGSSGKGYGAGYGYGGSGKGYNKRSILIEKLKEIQKRDAIQNTEANRALEQIKHILI
jgi:hypothetical protein